MFLVNGKKENRFELPKKVKNIKLLKHMLAPVDFWRPRQLPGLPVPKTGTVSLPVYTYAHIHIHSRYSGYPITYEYSGESWPRTAYG